MRIWPLRAHHSDSPLASRSATSGPVEPLPVMKHHPSLRVRRPAWLGEMLLALATGAAACKGHTDAAAAVYEEPPVSVRTEVVQMLEVPKTLRLTGTLKGDRETDLAANASGRVVATSVERGE